MQVRTNSVQFSLDAEKRLIYINIAVLLVHRLIGKLTLSKDIHRLDDLWVLMGILSGCRLFQ